MAERSVTIRILGDSKGGASAFRDVEVAAGKAETGIGRIATTAAGFAIGGALTQLPGILMNGAKGAAEDEAAMLRLRQAVTNTGKSYNDYGGAVEDAIKRGQELAFTDGETANALSTLVSLTGDTDEGMRRLSVAQDLARGTGISLEQAAKLLGKTSDENTAALSRMGIQVGKNATAQDVLNAVDEKFKGQAGVFAESGAGQMLKSQQAMGELAETAGSLLLPVMGLVATVMLSVANAASSLIGFLEPVTSLIGDNIVPILILLSPLLAGAAVVIGGAMVTAFVAWTTATWAQVVAALGLNTAMLPWIALFVAIGAAVALLYVAWQSNFLGIRDITAQVIDWLTPYITAALDAIFSAWNTVLPAIRAVVEVVFPIIAQVVTTYIGILKYEIELALSIIRAAWDLVFPALKAVVETVFPIIAEVVTTYIGIAKTAVEVGVTTIKTIFDGLVYIQGIVSDVFTTISGLVESLWNSGAVLLVASGFGTLKGIFEGAYDLFYGFGRSVLDGLVAGMAGVVDFVNGIVGGILDAYNKIPSFLRPGSPSKWAEEQSKSLVDGLVGPMQAGLPRIRRAVDDIINEYRRLPVGIPDGIPGPRPIPGIPDGIPGFGGDPTQASGGDATSGGGPGGKGQGMWRGGSSAAAVSAATAGAGGGGGGGGSSSRGWLAMQAGATFISCGQDGFGLFQWPDGRKQWLEASFCRDGQTGPSDIQQRHAASVSGTTAASAPQGSRLVAQTRTSSDGGMLSEDFEKRIERAVERGILRGLTRAM